MTLTIEGSVCPGYEPLADAFAELFEHFDEPGGSVALVRKGETLVELWAGCRDKAGREPWQQTTRCNVFSAGKAVVAVAILQLVERMDLDLDQPVADFWPDFGQCGKDSITLRQVLCHRSGVNAFHDKIPDELIYDWQRATAQVAAEQPWWPPGTEQGYSPILYGWLLGEVVRRLSGCDSFDAYVQQQIAGPLSLSWKFGLSDEELSTVAEVGPLPRAKGRPPASPLTQAILSEPQGLAAKAFANPPSLMIGTNQAAWRQAQIPAANGQATALDMARFYDALSQLDDERLLSARQRQRCWQEQSQATDRLLQSPVSFALGFMRLLPAGVESRRYFCHPGAGGSLGYGDASDGFGFGYVSRGMGPSILLDARAEHLLQAAYRAVRCDTA